MISQASMFVVRSGRTVAAVRLGRCMGCSGCDLAASAWMKASRSEEKIYTFASQVRAARAMLGWSQTQLATACGLPLMTLHRLESNQTKPRRRTVEALRRGLETAGVLLIEPDGAGGSGVRFALQLPERSRGNAGEA